MAGLLVAAGLMWLLNQWLGRHQESGNETVFKADQLVSSAAVSLGHGTNDAQKTMGVIAALLVATGHLQATGDELPIPLWVVLAAHTAIALGTISGGWRIVQTMGQRITELRPARGMAADGQMALAWVVTIPAAALAAAGVFALTQLGSHLLAGAALPSWAWAWPSPCGSGSSGPPAAGTSSPTSWPPRTRRLWCADQRRRPTRHRRRSTPTRPGCPGAACQSEATTGGCRA